jgi:hypothetical protein
MLEIMQDAGLENLGKMFPENGLAQETLAANRRIRCLDKTDESPA